MNKYQIGLAAAVLAASFVNNANAATINNVASGSVAVVGADCCRTGQVFSNIILDAANNRSNYLVFDLSSLASQLAGQDARSANLTLTQPGFYGSADPTDLYAMGLHRRRHRAEGLRLHQSAERSGRRGYPRRPAQWH